MFSCSSESSGEWSKALVKEVWRMTVNGAEQEEKSKLERCLFNSKCAAQLN